MTPESKRTQVARTLGTDAVTAEVVERLAEADVPALVLKGPGFARWLYDDPVDRLYVDTDLLVPPSRRRATERALRQLGFRAVRPGAAYADTWFRVSDGGIVDIHWTLLGVGRSGEATWAAFANDARDISVGRARVRVPGPAATALHAALHAIHHDGSPRTLADLGRALVRFDDEVWGEAVELAAGLDAVTALSAGLRLDSRGSALAERLGLPAGSLVEAELRAAGAPSQAFALRGIWAAPGLARKARLAAYYIVPSRASMQLTRPLARRGAAGLAAAHVVRLVRAALFIPRAVTALRRARRIHRTSSRRGD